MSGIKCPCCDGWGYRDVYRFASTTAVPDRVPCPACKATGVFSWDLHFKDLPSDVLTIADDHFEEILL